MQSQAYNQAVKTTVTATIAKLKAFQVSANQARNLKASNKDMLALVVDLQSDIKAAEASTKKNMWKVWQELATLAPARSWDVFNQRVEEVLNNWAALLATAESCIAAFEQTATAETLTEGQEVLTSIGQKATVEAVTEQGVVIAFADNSGKTTTDAANLHAIPTAEDMHLSKIESLLKAEGVDFMDEAAAVAVLEGTVLPTKNVKAYREELARRKASDLVLVQLPGFKCLNRVRGMGWVPVAAEEAKSYGNGADVPHLAASLSEALNCVVELRPRADVISSRNQAKAAAFEVLKTMQPRLAELEKWAEEADNRTKNEWVMAHGHAPLAYRTWYQLGQLCSAPVSVFEAPALALTMGNELAVKVEAQRGHSVGLRRRMNVVQQDINECKAVIAKAEEVLA